MSNEKQNLEKLYPTWIMRVMKEIKVTEDQAWQLIFKAFEGGEFGDAPCRGTWLAFLKETKNIKVFEDWLNDRLIPNTVFLNFDDYAEMCIDALKVVDKTTPTDYGTTRQRDYGQLWADITRGYLGEKEVEKFLYEKHGIEVDLPHERGELNTFLESDIGRVKKSAEEKRESKIKISIKAVKFNGIWMDITGQQPHHSDYFVQAKVGVGRKHLFEFFHELGVFEKLIFPKGKELEILKQNEIDSIKRSINPLKEIPIYISGFAQGKVHDNKVLPYSGRKSKDIKQKNGVIKRGGYTVWSWNGPYKEENLEISLTGEEEKISDVERIKDIEKASMVRLGGIGSLSKGDRYLFNTGSLLYKKEEWEKMVNEL